MTEMAIRSFVETNGRVPFQEWIDSLDRHIQARIAIGLTRLSRGNRSHVKGVGGGVVELKLDFGPGCRIYFGQDGDMLIILLAGGTKRRQSAISQRREPAGPNIKCARRSAIHEVCLWF